MTVVKCSYIGCEEVFKTEEPCTPDVTFTCRMHCDLLSSNREDKEVRFQRFAFDHKLDKHRKGDA